MNIEELARHYPTPFFAYDATVITARLNELKDAFANQNVKLYYAVKANDQRAVIELAKEAGVGSCLVSVGEMQRALAGGVMPSNMLMNGVGKTERDIRFALEQGIGQLNIESLPELSEVARIATELNSPVKICLRVNPEIQAQTHTHNTTARRTDKFGLLVEDLDEARTLIARYPVLDWRGFSCHIGSQIHGVNELAASYRRMVEIFTAERLSQPQFDRLDLGGGFGVTYGSEDYARPADYAALIGDLTHDLQRDGVMIQLEPGRFVIAEAGTLVTQVLYVKNSGGTRFVIVDAAMNNLIRPAMYDAYHPIFLARKSTAEMHLTMIAGPICESGDCFGRDRPLPDDVKKGDILGITYAGAYGMAMSSLYNARPLLAEVMVDGQQHRLIRRAFDAAEYDRLTLA